MNQWQQNLVILFAKVAGVLIGLLFLGYLLYYNLYFTTDALIKYVPKDAVAYATFRLTPELSKSELMAKIQNQLIIDYRLSAVDYSVLNQKVGNNLSLAVLPAGNEFKYLVLFDFGSDSTSANRYLDLAKLNNWQGQLFSNNFKNKNILAVSNSNEVLQTVTEITAKQQPALSQKIEVVFNLKKFEPDNFFGKAYLDTAYFQARYSQTDNIQHKLILSAFKNYNLNQFFCGFKVLDNKLVILNKADDAQAEEPNISGSDWPANISYALTFSDFPLKAQAVLDKLSQDDPKLYANLQTNKDYLASLYNFNWEKDVFPLVAGQSHLVLTNDKQYLLATTIKAEDVAVQTEKIEKLIKTYITTRYPVAKTKQLPDGSYVKIISRDTGSISFNEDNVMGVKIRLLNYNNQEFVYILTNNHLILANSRQLITELLDTDQKIQTWQNTGYLDNVSNFSQNAYVNMQNQAFRNNFINIFKALIFSENTGNEFRLILE
jgi:hypothetical protein